MMPGENIQDWSTTASSNSNADSAINWIEHMPRADVNNSARAMMAAHAKDRNLQNASITTTGTANAQAFNSGMTYTSVPTGLRVLLKVGAALTNTGPMTLNMDSIGAVTVKSRLGEDLKKDEFFAGGIVELLYNGTNWIIWSDPPASVTTVIVQPPVVINVGDPVATVEFTDLTDDFTSYVAIATDVTTDLMDDELTLQFSNDNGATYITSADYYDVIVQYLAALGDGNPLLYVIGGTTELTLVAPQDPANPAVAEVHLYGIGKPTVTEAIWTASHYNLGTWGQTFVQGTGTNVNANTVNAIRFGTLGGNIVTGRFTIYGVK